MKSTNVQRMPEGFANHVSMGNLVGLCVDDLLDTVEISGEKYTRIEIEIVQKDLAKGDGTWTITATADLEKK